MKKIYFATDFETINENGLNNGKIQLIRAKGIKNVYIQHSYSESKESILEKINVLKETLTLNFVTGSEAYENFDSPTEEHESFKIKDIKYRSYHKLKGSYIGKILDENKLVFKYLQYDQAPVTILSFLDRDVDIMNAIFASRVSLSIANAIIIGRNINDNKEDLYRHFQIPKSNGKMRDIYEPHSEIKEAFKDINRVLQATFNSKKDTNQFAYIKNRNIVKNAEIHRKNKYTIKTDVTAFFESTKIEYYDRHISFLCKDADLKEEFYTLIVNPNNDGLYMGNPISGTLTNLVMHKVIAYLQNIFSKKDISISVYADDIVVSSDKYLTKEYVTDTINWVFDYYELGYVLKPEKTVRLTNQNRRICGVTINHKDQLTIKRSDYENVRVSLYKLSKGENINIPIGTLMGRLNFYLYVDTTGKFNKLLNKYDKILSDVGFRYKEEQIMMDI